MVTGNDILIGTDSSWTEIGRDESSSGDGMAKDEFSRDLDSLLSRIRPAADSGTMDQLREIRNRLVALKRKQLVQINHSVMEVICARHLMATGYSVKVEYPLDKGTIIADIFATRPRQSGAPNSRRHTDASEERGLLEDTETLVVEVETGYVPPMAALSPVQYGQARMAAKTARYGRHGDYFALATPVYNVLPIPDHLFDAPDIRSREHTDQLKALCDRYYRSPPVTWESLAAARIDNIYVVDVDSTNVVQVQASDYHSTVLAACFHALCSTTDTTSP